MGFDQATADAHQPEAQEGQSVKAIWKVPCPGAHKTGHPQTVHDLASYLAAVPRSCTNEPSTVNTPHLTCCKIEPNPSEKPQCLLQKSIYSLMWGTNASANGK